MMPKKPEDTDPYVQATVAALWGGGSESTDEVALMPSRLSDWDESVLDSDEVALKLTDTDQCQLHKRGGMTKRIPPVKSDRLMSMRNRSLRYPPAQGPLGVSPREWRRVEWTTEHALEALLGLVLFIFVGLLIYGATYQLF